MKKALLILSLTIPFTSLLFSQSSEELVPKTDIIEDLTSKETKTEEKEAISSSEEKSKDNEELIPFTDLIDAEKDIKKLEEDKKAIREKKDEDENTSSKTKNKDELKEKEYESTTETEEIKEQEKKIEKIPLSIASEEILSRPDVENFRKQYMTPKWSKLLYSYLENAMEYRLYVRKAVQDRNLPEVLEYLPVVESNYKTNARSKSGAVGMWQFMANSVASFLTLNDFVDERLDPWYSTNAGLSKLTENYNYYKDWNLAIAAYNCGLGAMNKALKKSPVKDYWYMVDHHLLPRQTAEYVPKLLAIADLAINSEYYGIDLPSHKEEFEVLENEKNGHYDYITVSKAYSLSSLAKELRISDSIMKRLNPSFIHGITHPAQKSKIRLPLGLAKSGETAITKLTPIDYPFKYKVVAGDSLWSISRKYHTTVDAICELNNIKENDILRIGKILYIPSK